MSFLIRTFVSALIIAIASELGKRFTLLSAILVSLPLTSILTIIWLYLDTRERQPIISLSVGIFWAVLPSLIFFASLVVLLRTPLSFAWALILSCTIMIGAYGLYALILNQFGIEI
jgi:hypothetical protein